MSGPPFSGMIMALTKNLFERQGAKWSLHADGRTRMIAPEGHWALRLRLDDEEDLLVVEASELPEGVLHPGDDDTRPESRHTFTLAELRSL